jgi:hypothetical protein
VTVCAQGDVRGCDTGSGAGNTTGPYYPYPCEYDYYYLDEGLDVILDVDRPNGDLAAPAAQAPGRATACRAADAGDRRTSPAVDIESVCRGVRQRLVDVDARLAHRGGSPQRRIDARAPQIGTLEPGVLHAGAL